jgi:hypothetical protein
MSLALRANEGGCAYVRERMYSKWWCSWQPLRLDGPSRPSLLLGARAGIELACTSYVTGFVDEG